MNGSLGHGEDPIAQRHFFIFKKDFIAFVIKGFVAILNARDAPIQDMVFQLIFRCANTFAIVSAQVFWRIGNPAWVVVAPGKGTEISVHRHRIFKLDRNKPTHVRRHCPLCFSVKKVAMPLGIHEQITFKIIAHRIDESHHVVFGHGHKGVVVAKKVVGIFTLHVRKLFGIPTHLWNVGLKAGGEKAVTQNFTGFKQNELRGITWCVQKVRVGFLVIHVRHVIAVVTPGVDLTVELHGVGLNGGVINHFTNLVLLLFKALHGFGSGLIGLIHTLGRGSRSAGQGATAVLGLRCG